MKVIYLSSSESINLKTITLGKIYDVIDEYRFGNRQPEYKIVNDLGTHIWVSSKFLHILEDYRDNKITKVLF